MPSRRLDLAHQSIQVGAAASRHCNLRPFLCQSDRRGPSDALACPGDQRYLAFQSSIHSNLLRLYYECASWVLLQTCCQSPSLSQFRKRSMSPNVRRLRIRGAFIKAKRACGSDTGGVNSLKFNGA